MKVEEVVDFDKKAEESKEKNVRLYTEVRYAKNSCLSIKHTASVFRLKHDHKNLSSKEYVENLSQYLGDARSKKMLTTEDLQDLLVKLNENCAQQNEDDVCISSSVANDNDIIVYGPDEHIVAVLIDEKDSVLSWFLGVVESISTDEIYAKYYNRLDKNGLSWNFLDDDSIAIPTPRDQIIFGGITVSYMQTSIIRCALDRKTIIAIENAFETYSSKI